MCHYTHLAVCDSAGSNCPANGNAVALLPIAEEIKGNTMSVVYIVRCNFSDPNKEEDWNVWYSGPKIKQMLAKPYFRAGQRFRKALGTGRYYLALWLLDSPEAFKTTEYTSDWGFFDWSPFIADWSRDLFSGEGHSDSDFAVSAQGGLQVVSFDGVSPTDATDARAEIEKLLPGVMWFPVIGLDRHTPLIGLRQLSDISTSKLYGAPLPAGAQEAVYRPICKFQSAETIAAA